MFHRFIYDTTDSDLNSINTLVRNKVDDLFIGIHALVVTWENATSFDPIPKGSGTRVSL